MTFGMDDPAVGYLVGDKHDGIRQMFRVIENARMMIGTKAMGTLSTGYLNALEYAKERRQGADLLEAADKTAPRVPIIDHPNVRRMLMQQKTYTEGLRALVLYTAWLQDQAALDPDDDRWERRNQLLLPLVKGYSSERAYELLAMSLQVFGGSGYTQDYPIEQYIRDAKIDTIYEGTTGIQALDLFFRKIARDQGETLAALAAEILEFVKGGGGRDPLAAERQQLGVLLDDTQTQLGSMVEDLMASLAGDKELLYEVGLHTNALLESLAEVVIAWQLLRQAEVAIGRVDEDPFYRGKVESARWFIKDVASKIAARRDAVAAEDARDRHAAPAVVAGRRPDRAVAGRVVLPGDDARRQAAIRRQHLVRADHREAVAERHDDLGLHAGQRLGQHQMVGHRDARAPVGAVVPGNAEQVARIHRVGVDIGQRGNDRVGHRRRVGEFRELGQHDSRGSKMRHRAGVVLAIDDLAFEAESRHDSSFRGQMRRGW